MSKRELLMNGLLDQAATLGRHFFTAAYLMVNRDAKTFTMWQANPSTRSTLVPVLSKSTGECGSSGEGSTGGGGNGGTSQDSGSGSGSDNASKTSSIGASAIAGGAVGGIAVLAALAVTFICFRRRKWKAATYVNSTTSESDTSASEFALKAEQSGPQEVHGTDLYQTYGKPVELRGDHELRVPYQQWKSNGQERERQ